MNGIPPSLCRALCGLALVSALSTGLSAQSVLMAEHGGKILPVVKAEGFRACVEANGAVVVASGSRLGLSPAKEYLPVLVSLLGVDATAKFAATSVAGGTATASTFGFSAKLESPFKLTDVFLVLEIDTRAGKSLFLSEIGTLPPYEPVPVEAAVPLPAAMGDARYQVHIFSAGAEVFNSSMPFDYREGMLDRMVSARVQNALVDSAPKLFVGPAPEYPRRLRSSGLRGNAVIAIRVTAKGAVLDPVVRSASDPAFGEAAIAAVRLWRFLPMIRLGQPVETTIDLPFAFTPPKGPAAG